MRNEGNINACKSYIRFCNRRQITDSEAPRGKPRGIFAEPCEAKNAIPPCGKPQGFLAKKGDGEPAHAILPLP